jgi:hypothetical protein
MKRILQIATGHQALKALFTGSAPLPVLLWALVDEDGPTSLVVGMVMDPLSKRVVPADELEGFAGYSA